MMGTGNLVQDLLEELVKETKEMKQELKIIKENTTK